MKIAIIGLGYVGIQLATGLGRQYATMGFDLDAAISSITLESASQSTAVHPKETFSTKNSHRFILA